MEKYMFIIMPFISLIICQLIKFSVESIKTKKLNIERLFNGAGGMPSSHATFSFTLTFMLLYNFGLSSELFAISLIFSMIVCYDAMGVRYESGKQAEIINDLAELFEKEEKKKKRKVIFARLKEQLGHKPVEVLMGILLSLVIVTIYNFII